MICIKFFFYLLAFFYIKVWRDYADYSKILFRDQNAAVTELNNFLKYGPVQWKSFWHLSPFVMQNYLGIKKTVWATSFRFCRWLQCTLLILQSFWVYCHDARLLLLSDNVRLHRAEFTVLGHGSYSANSSARLLVQMNVRRDHSWAHFNIHLIEKLFSLLISV